MLPVWDGPPRSERGYRRSILIEPTPFNAHVSEDTLEEYAFHRLSEDKVGPLEEHLLICSTCQERLRQLDEYILLMKRGTEKFELAKARARKHAPFGIKIWLGAGAMAAVALALVVMIPRAPLGSPSEVQLVAFRGEQMAHTVAGRRVDLMIDVSDLAPSGLYRVEVVDAEGREEWSGQATASGSKLLVPVSKSLRRGVHWVRLSTAEGALLREFGLRVD